MTLPRRTLLSRVLAALSAPAVALGAGRRKNPEFDALRLQLKKTQETRADFFRFWQRSEQVAADMESSLYEARGLLAEARGHFQGCNEANPDFPPHTSLVARIDKHLGRGAGREGQG